MNPFRIGIHRLPFAEGRWASASWRSCRWWPRRQRPTRVLDAPRWAERHRHPLGLPRRDDRERALEPGVLLCVLQIVAAATTAHHCFFQHTPTPRLRAPDSPLNAAPARACRRAGPTSTRSSSARTCFSSSFWPPTFLLFLHNKNIAGKQRCAEPDEPAPRAAPRWSPNPRQRATSPRPERASTPSLKPRPALARPRPARKRPRPRASGKDRPYGPPDRPQRT